MPRLLSIFLSVSIALLSQTQQFPIPIEKPVETLENTPIFGTTVVSTTGFMGQIYFLHEGTDFLPKFTKMKPKGTIYTTRLNVAPRSFTQGFPGLTNRFEWFGIQYTAKFWIKNPGNYEFAMLSDDGSKLHIDGKEIIDNDGLHSPRIIRGFAKLAEGPHRIQVSYFQGPRTSLALVLAVGLPGKDWRIFDTNEFLPPSDKLDQWTAFDADGNGKKRSK